MVTLQILVLSFLVRVRVSQQQFEHHPTRVMLFLFIYIPDKVVEITAHPINGVSGYLVGISINLCKSIQKELFINDTP